MTAAQHTPGPLEVVGNLVRTSMVEDGTPRGIMVAECFDQHGYRYSDEAKANARLYAAAPELLEVVRTIVRVADGRTIPGNLILDENSPLMDAARDAIAKATGSAS